MPKAKRLKRWAGIYRGTHNAVVVAFSQKEAAALTGESVYSFRQYWSGLNVQELVGIGFKPGLWIAKTPGVSGSDYCRKLGADNS